MDSMLDKIESPQDLKKLNIKELKQLAKEIRQLLIEKISIAGGHLGSNLGIVEMCIALHYVFQTPKDKIIYDGSHQTYVHKILTDRKNRFYKFGEYGGITGLSNSDESEHDIFKVGHTSTSISLSIGLAIARDLLQKKGNIISVIGDGCLSGGESFEALNNACKVNGQLLIIVNDNNMSIAENQGGLYKNLRDLRETKGKCSNNYFKSMGLEYRYIDEGNDIQTLIEELEKVKDYNKPIVLHIYTEKGKGYKFAEEDKEKYHWADPFNVENGRFYSENDTKMTYKKAIEKHLEELVKKNEKIVAINAAIPIILGIKEFREKYSEKYIDVGIAEQHSISLAAGMAKNGMKPIVLHMASFLQRGYDQIFQDCCMNKQNVVIIVEGAGISYGNESHSGMYDIPMMTHIPNLIYIAPRDGKELEMMMDWALEQNTTIGIRVPFNYLPGDDGKTRKSIELGKYEVIEKGNEIAILALGNFFELGKRFKEQIKIKFNIEATFINPRFINNLDSDLLNDLLVEHKKIITLEDGILDGGFGEKISRFYSDKDIKVYNFGADREFADKIKLNELMKKYNLTVDKIINKIF